MTPKKFTYYSFDKIYSFNGVYNFIVGDRGIGKTYGAKRKVIRDAIKHGHEFVYCRRYKEDLKTRTTFFADISHEFPKWDFRVNGMRAEMAPASTRDDKKRPWKIIGYFVALSQSASYKSQPFPNVRTIIFDEFIIEKGVIRYLNNEASVFNDLYLTVDRFQDRTRVLFLANAVTITNPYFIEYDIKPDVGTEFIVKNDGFIVVQFIQETSFRYEVYESRFGKMIKDTDYAKYSVESQFSDNNDFLLELKDSTAKYYYTVDTLHGIFSVWYDTITSMYYIQKKRPKEELLYTLIPERMKEGWTLLQYNNKLLQYLRASFNNDRMRFDSPQARNAFIEIFRNRR